MLGVARWAAGKIEVSLASCSPGDARTKLGLESRTDSYSAIVSPLDDSQKQQWEWAWAYIRACTHIGICVTLKNTSKP